MSQEKARHNLEKRIDRLVIAVGGIVFLSALGWIIAENNDVNGYLEPANKIEVDVSKCSDPAVKGYLRKINVFVTDVASIIGTAKGGDMGELLSARDQAWQLVIDFNALDVPPVFSEFHQCSFSGYVQLAEALEAKIARDQSLYQRCIDLCLEQIHRAGDIFEQILEQCGYFRRPDGVAVCNE